ncbi:MAG: hypothetical protein KDA17_06765 [Candidatus Saccharibacteria bacterium]|nr:hypothetical protein [Candidatus Saccharibacteria bacterium]MCA9336372.1 hypothetical protein [Candidatus Saccharibacteria bacterium]MCA9340590.1 hypothetical protein [Candidatus Saccharibacteria bacterium]
MIYCIEGTNALRIREEIAKIHARAGGELERIDGASLTENQLPDLLGGATLFTDKRCIVVRGLSENAAVWERLGEWVGRMHDDTTLILVEDKLDKRTKTYKDLIKRAEVTTADYWTERDLGRAEQWLVGLAKSHSLKLDTAQVRDMVQRALLPAEKPGQSYIDQMQLLQAVRALSVLDTVTEDAISAVLPPAAGESVFRLLEYAARRSHEEVRKLLSDLERTDEPHMVFAMLAKQWTQLVAVALAGERAGELGIHPFVLGKLQTQARLISRADIREITQLAASLDARLKRSEVSAWEAVDRFVFAIALR